MKYKNIQVESDAEVEAVQWTGKNYREMYDFLTDDINGYIQPYGENFYIDHGKVNGGLVIKTLDGAAIANIDDFIIKHSNDKFSPCNSDIFSKTYKLVLSL